MEVRTSRLFKQQVAELFRYLKVTFGKRIAVSVRDEIKEQLLRLKEFPQMGAVESQLEGEPDEPSDVGASDEETADGDTTNEPAV